MEKLFECKFTIDTGYDYYEYFCIINAVDKESAREALFKYVEPKLKGDRCISDYLITEIDYDNYPIIYTDFNK